MDLTHYNSDYAISPNGFINLGNLCYCNSLLQCLLSCTSIFEVLEKNKHKKRIQTNLFAQTLLKLFNESKNNDDITRKNIPIWSSLIAMSKKRQDKIKFDIGQQDAHEGLMLVLNAIENINELRRLFEYRHNIKIFCETCNKNVVDKDETNLVFEVQPDLKTEQHEKFKDLDTYYNTSMPLNEFLRKQNGYVDENFICPECKNKGYKFKTTTLKMIPEILPIVIKKYEEKCVTPFPMTLEFTAKGRSNKLLYKLVAQSEHTGGRNSGHYWAVCLRKNADSLGWYRLNDSSVDSAEPGPTMNSYILFYHFTGSVAV